MSSKTVGLGLRLGAASLLLLVAAGCSSTNTPTPGSTPAPAPSSASARSSSPDSPAPEPSRPPGSTPPPPATTPVPPSTPGDVNSTVPSRPEASKSPVAIDKPSETGTGVTVRLVDLKATNAKASLPGEVAGPAVAITVDVTNTGDKAVDLNTVVVTLADADDAPGSEMTSPPAKPLRGSVAPAKSTRGVYVFTVPRDKRNPVTVSVTVGSAPVLVFKGNAR